MPCLSELTLDHLAPLVGRDVAVQADGHEMVFRLQGVEKARRGSAIGGRHPFSLTLVGPRGMRSPQMTMTFSFEGLGAYDLFAVPFAYAEPDAEDSPLLYQISFN